MLVISILFFGSIFCSYCPLRTNLCFLFDGFTDVILQKVKVCFVLTCDCGFIDMVVLLSRFLIAVYFTCNKISRYSRSPSPYRRYRSDSRSLSRSRSTSRSR